MLRHQLVEAWQFARPVAREQAERVAMERTGAPDLHIVLLSAGRGWARAHVVSGVPQVGALLYVDGLGLYEITRRDEWGSVAGDRSRVLLALRAQPPGGISEAGPAAGAERDGSA